MKFLRRHGALIVVGLVIGLGVAAAAFWGPTWWTERQAAQRAQVLADALAAFNKGDAKAVKWAITTFEADPATADHATLMRGGYLLMHDNLEGALRAFGSLAPPGQTPDGELRDPAILLTGECLYRMGRKADAARMLQSIYERDPENPLVLRWLGAIFYDLGAFEIARSLLTALAELEPDDWSPHRLMGSMAYDFRDYGAAIDHLRKALERNPPQQDREEIIRELTESLVEQRKYEQAEEILPKSTDDPFLLALQAECHLGLGRLPKARALLDESISKWPRERRLLLLHSRILLQEDKVEEAIEPLVTVLENNPHDVECRYELALVYRKLGRKDDFQREMELKDASHKLRDELHDLSVKATTNIRDAELRDRLAELCDQLGKRELAKVWRSIAADIRNGRETFERLQRPGAAPAP